MEKKDSLIQDLTKANSRLEAALNEPYSQIVQDAAIQRF